MKFTRDYDKILTMNKYDLNNLKVGERIELGWYPQSIVTDDDTIKALKEICGKPKLSRGSLWKDYNYATGSGMYADINFSDKRYRVVYKKKHRDGEVYEFSDYPDGKIYITLYEPILWRVLKITDNKAMIVSEKLIDGQEFSILKKRERKKAKINKNNYEYSFVRQWLNNEFFETAFNDIEKSAVETIVVCNAASTTRNEINPYACNDTEDKVSLLSFQEAKTLFENNKARWKKVTEYAKMQGCFGYRTHDAKYDNSSWWLRSPHNKIETWVMEVGDGGGLHGFGSFDNCEAIKGIAPAVYIKI